MLKIITSLTLLLFGMLAKGQVSENRTISEFSKVAISGGIELIYSENPKVSLQVVSNNPEIAKNTITEVDGKTLKIYLTEGNQLAANDIVKVYVSAPHIDALKAGSNAKITIIERLNASKMNIVLESGATLTGNIKTSGKTKLTAKQNTLFNGKIEALALEGNFKSNAKINLTGNAKNASFQTYDGSLLAARNFIASNIKLSAYGKSKSTIYANTKIDVNVADEASVIYTGFPEEIVLNEEAESFKKINYKQSISYNDATK